FLYCSMVIQQPAVKSEIYHKKIGDFMESLGVEYQDISIYILAFIHRSIVNEKPDLAPEHNERLEFLGDAVLELVITDNLFAEFPDKPEGELTDLRSALVRGKNLGKIAHELGVQKYLFLGKGEDQSGGRENEYILANTMEAIIGAIYLDTDMKEVTKFIHTYIYPSLEEILKNNLTKDFKTLVQEYTQAEFDITPRYELIHECGPDHDKHFEIGLFLNHKLIKTGVGSSKKKAQEEAAQNSYYFFTQK
ncbi:ribonuclease III, partial [Candidatus Gracilibacteria bacterium]|nr:ribonuclease III [Candidatus Gracilibacteria bacterium]